MKKITIVGGGLVGSLLSVYLAKRGHKVTVYERRPDMRKNPVSAGKSINLALSDRGWKGLAGVNLEEPVRKVAIPMYGRMIHNPNGEIAYQPYGKSGQAIWSVSRGGLNRELMTLAEQNQNVSFHFNEKCLSVNMDVPEAVFENQETGMVSHVQSDILFGADGAFSSLRLAMQLNTDRFNYSQSYLEHGYKELVIPPGKDGGFQLEKHALHIWPRGTFMLIALPNMDASFTCTLFFPFEGKESFAALNTPEKLKQFFRDVFPDALTFMPTLADDFFSNPTGSLVTVKCYPWTYRDKCALIGDAAHAVVPFYGQGMNCGFEDCTVLNELVNSGSGWEEILHQYGKSRKPNADAIADMAVENFYEMRDLVADPAFLLRKKIEAKIFERHPAEWVPQYSLVTFSHEPYLHAMQTGRLHNSIMDKVMAIPGIQDTWDSAEVEALIMNHLKS